MTAISTWYGAHKGLFIAILGVIVGLDHVLAGIPSVQASSTFQLISGWVAKAYSAIAGASS